MNRSELEGITCSKTNQEVPAWQQVTLEELPVVLILHLKCFDFKKDGCTKILKTVEFPVELKLDQSKLHRKVVSFRSVNNIFLYIRNYGIEEQIPSEAKTI